MREGETCLVDKKNRMKSPRLTRAGPSIYRVDKSAALIHCGPRLNAWSDGDILRSVEASTAFTDRRQIAAGCCAGFSSAAGQHGRGRSAATIAAFTKFGNYFVFQ